MTGDVEQDAIIKFFTEMGHDRPFISMGRISRIGSMNVLWSTNRISRIGNFRVDYSMNRISRIGNWRVNWSGNRITSISVGDVRV
ncbi:MAG: hypothetical protein FWE16_03085 [Firmicutes bacterium]|nr:hypothetical protein [Bacillota bacterium]